MPISPKSVLASVMSLAWLGKQFDLVSGSITNSEGAMTVAVAKWLVLATGFCIRKRVESAIRKLRWLARPHTPCVFRFISPPSLRAVFLLSTVLCPCCAVGFLSPVLAGPCAHSLWGPRFLPHTLIAILRSLALVLALAPLTLHSAPPFFVE